MAVCKSLNETDQPAPEPRTAEQMYERGEQVSADQRAFGTINEVLPYAPFLLKQAHKLFSQLMPGTGKVRWSHEIFPSPRTTRFNEMEYALPYAKGPDALREIVETIRKKRINTGFPIEYRSVAADDVWMSPFYERESATIAVHQYHRVDTARLFDACEAIFRGYQGRPHWGKRHTRNAQELSGLYPQIRGVPQPAAPARSERQVPQSAFARDVRIALARSLAIEAARCAGVTGGSRSDRFSAAACRRRNPPKPRRGVVCGPTSRPCAKPGRATGTSR